MAAGGDVLLQLLDEVRDLQQEVRTEHERIDGQFKRVDERFERIEEEFRLARTDMGTLARTFHSTRELHEQYFIKVGRTLNMLADEQAKDRARFEDHLRCGHDPQPA